MFAVFKQREFEDMRHLGMQLYIYTHIHRVVPFSSNSDHKHPHNRQLCDTVDPFFLQLLPITGGQGFFQPK